MEDNMPATISAIAAMISAGTAFISVIISLYITLRKSRRQLLDELKLIILECVSTQQGFVKWKEVTQLDGIEGSGVPISCLSKVLGKKYQKKKWERLLPAAVIELKNEGYHEELSMSASRTVIKGGLKIISE